MIKTIFWVLTLVGAYQLGLHMHPYEMCTRKGFIAPVEIGECIWLLTEQPGLQ